MNPSRKIHQLLIINHLIIKIINMKKTLKISSLLLSIFIIFPSYAGVYDDWPDEAICTWLEQRPNHKGYLEENKKRDLNQYLQWLQCLAVTARQEIEPIMWRVGSEGALLIDHTLERKALSYLGCVQLSFIQGRLLGSLM